jgi:hypothetical protein
VVALEAVRELVEESSRLGVGGQRGGEVAGNVDLARSVRDRQRDVDGVTAFQAGLLAYVPRNSVG